MVRLVKFSAVQASGLLGINKVLVSYILSTAFRSIWTSLIRALSALIAIRSAFEGWETRYIIYNTISIFTTFPLLFRVKLLLWLGFPCSNHLQYILPSAEPDHESMLSLRVASRALFVVFVVFFFCFFWFFLPIFATKNINGSGGSGRRLKLWAFGGNVKFEGQWQ